MGDERMGMVRYLNVLFTLCLFLFLLCRIQKIVDENLVVFFVSCFFAGKNKQKKTKGDIVN